MYSYHYASKIEVQFRDCDPLGHVNNAVYVTYFEIARVAYCRDALGFTLEDAVGSESFRDKVERFEQTTFARPAPAPAAPTV